MFVLDTNVLSALMLQRPASEVITWLASQPAELLFTTVVTQAEILAGLAVMPAGRRKAALTAAAAAIFEQEFQGRVLIFEARAAAIYAELFATRRSLGRPTTVLDLMIAAITKANGARIVTRDTGGFEGCDIEVVNPWKLN